VGNDANPYLLNSVFVPGVVSDNYNNSQLTFPFNGVPGFTVGGVIGNPNLTPEFTTSYETGVELSLFRADSELMRPIITINNRPDHYIANRRHVGYTAQVTNVGQISNRGLELLLRGIPAKTKDFTWEVTATFSKNKSNVDELAEGTSRITLPEVLMGDLWLRN
jgi:outer membrane receptor protein involved in Fe transport